MRITNKFGLPDTILRAAKADDYSRGEARKSVTQLINSPRIDVLRRTHYPQMEQDVSEMIWSLLGRGVHAVLEKGVTEEHVSEERLYMDIDGWTISGAIDLQHVSGTTASGKKACVIQDYKVCSIYAIKHPKIEWEKQQNVYAALVEHVKPDVEVVGIQIVAIIRDWSRHQASYAKAYPKAPIQVIDLPLWSSEDRMAFIKDRVQEHQAAEAAHHIGMDLPDCTSADMWEKPPVFAVKRKGARSAKKIFDDFLEAVDFTENNPGYEVEARPGTRMRCEGNFCGVSKWCKQWAEYKASLPQAEEDPLA
jgi:hypothetical protein